MQRKPNSLIHASSPYLLQHAYNPVDWNEWNDDSLERAVRDNKMILVSIGYSACHWCHVMEHESFEDNEVAEIMNQFFVCIKVDREERPDIDQVYMTAVQLMTGKGGWPLNCFTLPDGRPVYGGTYFPKKQWINILLNLADGFKNERGRFEDYAVQLTEGIRSSEVIPAIEEISEFSDSLLVESVSNWKKHFDMVEGGPDRAPKFPLPNNYQFLLRYAYNHHDEELDKHIQLTLEKMGNGGIYDQIGGGFCRYSVDGIWKVPHFEKMLYDNAQLVSLYSEAYKRFPNYSYQDIVFQTLEFLKRELTGPEGNFYSALDADSEGVEGKYYTWTRDELKGILGDDFDFFASVYNVNEKGFWEHDQYILLRDKDEKILASEIGLGLDEFRNKISVLRKKVLEVREKRIKPGLDDKTLLSWNSLMVCAYLDAFDAFGEKQFYDAAEKNINFVISKMINPQGGLFHNYKNGTATINGFLEDYAFFVQALIRMYQTGFRIEYLEQARELMEYTLQHFKANDNELLYFTSDTDRGLITRSKENQDNVIPASNSQMAINLFQLGHYFENEDWKKKSQQMLSAMKPFLTSYGSGYSNWLSCWLYESRPLNELVICGDEAIDKRNEMVGHDLPPGIIIAGTASVESLEMLKGRLQKDHTLIYVCKDKHCQLPVSSVGVAMENLRV